MNITSPPLLTDDRIFISGTDAAPTVDEDGGALPVGRELVRDTGGHAYWAGTEWKPVTVEQKLCQIAEFLREIRDKLLSEE